MIGLPSVIASKAEQTSGTVLVAYPVFIPEMRVENLVFALS